MVVIEAANSALRRSTASLLANAKHIKGGPRPLGDSRISCSLPPSYRRRRTLPGALPWWQSANVKPSPSPRTDSGSRLRGDIAALSFVAIGPAPPCAAPGAMQIDSRRPGLARRPRMVYALVEHVTWKLVLAVAGALVDLLLRIFDRRSRSQPHPRNSS